MYKVNLLPEYLQHRDVAICKRKLLVLGGSGIVLLSLLIGYGIFYLQFISDQHRLDRDTEELAKLRPRVAEIQRLKGEIKAKQEQYYTFSRILEKRLSWHRMLQDLSLALPRDTWINRLEIKKVERPPGSGGFASSGYKPVAEVKVESAESKGKPVSNLQSPPVPNVMYLYGTCWTMGSVGVLVNNLSRLPYFDSVKLVEAKHDKEKGIILFELAASVRGGEWDVKEIPKSQP
ncbi:type IV pilus assembly protein PilN [Desulforamulus putei DSM 12395]|uniref:Type IV pilus assembly protein PilN n=1 Tax=Desulforamulus putei DSM 12395 TaxID=1121429 RepID=A0A1M4UVQ0_9FIRM|nr:PilN domain-containing protein [Desulforamulus putei]SHE60765.1 type IV pilus assembly protein PilN [Desulforamulus putei DSM 12395]